VEELSRDSASMIKACKKQKINKINKSMSKAVISFHLG
jgi:hypothetical protein